MFKNNQLDIKQRNIWIGELSRLYAHLQRLTAKENISYGILLILKILTWKKIMSCNCINQVKKHKLYPTWYLGRQLYNLGNRYVFK